MWRDNLKHGAPRTAMQLRGNPGSPTSTKCVGWRAMRREFVPCGTASAHRRCQLSGPWCGLGSLQGPKYVVCITTGWIVRTLHILCRLATLHTGRVAMVWGWGCFKGWSCKTKWLLQEPDHMFSACCHLWSLPGRCTTNGPSAHSLFAHSWLFASVQETCPRKPSILPGNLVYWETGSSPLACGYSCL